MPSTPARDRRRGWLTAGIGVVALALAGWLGFGLGAFEPRPDGLIERQLGE